jgi:hypothetical protein
MKSAILAGAVALTFSAAARAEVGAQWDTGFELRNTVEADVGAARAYQALGEIGGWWSGAHTYSGSAANLSMPLKPGACFCEALPEGGVAHGTVVLAWPAQGTVRIDGALGPLQALAVSGALTFQVKPKGAGRVEVVQTYAVSGGRPGLARDLAGPVDQVMREQLVRFGRYLATGKPD